jgi:hypothetical protein
MTDRNVGAFYGAYYSRSNLSCLQPQPQNVAGIARAISAERERILNAGGPKGRSVFWFCVFR